MYQSLLHTPEGVRDIYGTEYAGKLMLESRLHDAIRLFGYQDIQTPTFEYFDVFSKEIGTTPSSMLYKFFDKDGNTLVLRPDFTPSCARCAAKYFMNEKTPLRFTYSGNTFTNNSSLQGKLKEVTQMGAELILDGSVQADAEMILMVIEALKASGLQDFQITIGEVEYFQGVCSQAGISDTDADRLRDAILAKNYFNAREILEESGVRKDYAKVLLRLADTVTATDSLAEAKQLVDNERSLLAIERLEKLYELLANCGAEKYVHFDLGLLSKFHYYTGILFKGYTYGVGDAIVSGGRYDKLLSYFGKNAPAIGFVIVVDDLMEALKRQDKKLQPKKEGILIIYEPAAYARAFEQANTLRSRGIPAELSPVCDNIDCHVQQAKRHMQKEIQLFKADQTLEILTICEED